MNFSGRWEQVRPWYFGYMLQGAVVFGIGGILMPIIVDQAGSAALAGTVIAFFYLGQLLAPLVGALTDRTGQHKLFYLSGYVLLGIGLGLFPTTTTAWFWMVLAFIQGLGSGTSNTVATMFIVEFRPKSEWDSRISWLQTFYGVGQCLGLALVSLLQATPAVGLFVSAGMMGLGAVIGGMGLPASAEHKKPHQTKFEHRKHMPARSLVSPRARYEADLIKALTRIKQEAMSEFGLFIVGWFFVMLATWLLGALFPLVMKKALGISYANSSLYYGLGAAIGIFAYVPSGWLGKKIGDGPVVIIGTLLTMLPLTGMAIFSYVHTSVNYWLVPLIYIWIPVAWSPLMVGGNAWTAKLATFPEGEALGSFNAATALSSVVAALGSGIIAHIFNYGMILVIGAACSLVALIFFLYLLAGAKGRGQDADKNHKIKE